MSRRRLRNGRFKSRWSANRQQCHGRMGFRAQSLGADSERDITGDGRQRDVALIALERIGFSVAVTTGMIGIKTGICMRRVKFVRLAVMVSQFDPETFSHGAGQGRKHENYRHQNQKRRGEYAVLPP